MKTKIEIKTIIGAVLFEYEKENNTIKKTLEEAVNEGADLRGANLRGADLQGADLQGANLRGAYLRGADLQDADLQGADLRGADLQDADLRGADLQDANLRGADLRGAYLRGADLRGANLRGAYLRGADLQDANLRGADLRGADLQGADLRGADLQDADLRGAYLQDANLRGANLRGAYLRGANLQDAYLRGADFDKLPQSYINECSQQMLYIFHYTRKEVPYLRKALMEGNVDGSQYKGECCCLVGTLAKDGQESVKIQEVDKYCTIIPYYRKSADNPAEGFFLNINKGDTPENNEYAKFAVKLIDEFLSLNKYDSELTGNKFSD